MTLGQHFALKLLQQLTEARKTTSLVFQDFLVGL